MAEEQQSITGRRQTNLGSGRPAGMLHRARSTVWKVLWRHGLSRQPRGVRRSFRRSEWSRPGALLHMDVKNSPAFSVPGHRATGSRRDHHRSRGISYDYLHRVVDDHSRAYDERDS